METGTKIERDEERVAAEQGKRMMVRMSAMWEWEQALRIRSQRQLNNLRQNLTKHRELKRICRFFFSVLILRFLHRWNVFYLNARLIRYEPITKVGHIMYANQVCLPVRLTFFQHKNIHKTHIYLYYSMSMYQQFLRRAFNNFFFMTFL